MDDGLIFAGDTEDNISRTLNGTLKIYGGVTDKDSLSTGSNIGVVASSDGLQLKLAKDLTGIDSLTGLTNTTLDVAGFGASHRAATEEQLVLMKGSIINSQQGGGFCAKCGTKLSAGAKFCPNCGAKQNAANVCPGCGQPVQPGAKFCANCGQKL